MTPITRRSALKGTFGLAAGAAAAAALTACRAAPGRASGVATVQVMGMIHARHRTSARFSLDILRAAVLKAKPDVILTEIPPGRVAQALRSYEETGAVDEPRTNVFPEYTDVIIPLAGPQGWRVIGTAAWTPDIARRRAAALETIANDPARAGQWAQHLAAQRAFAEATRGRGDDPRFIHSSEYDRLTAASRGPYETHFDADLGAGGWRRINEGHNALINAALDSLPDQGLRVLITYGAAHKYRILENLARRTDVVVEDAARLFD